MKTFLLRHKWALIGAVLGAAGGYTWYSRIGCISGTCPITSRPLASTLYGAVIGSLLAGAISDFVRRK